MKKILPSPEGFSQGLYMFDIGQNDIDGAFFSKSDDQVFTLIPTILSEFQTGMKVVKYYFGILFNEHFI